MKLETESGFAPQIECNIEDSKYARNILIAKYLRDRIARQTQNFVTSKFFPIILQSAEDEPGSSDESDSYADSYYTLRDDGRNPDGTGESYADRNV